MPTPQKPSLELNIKLPSFISDAFVPVNSEESYVSHRVKVASQKEKEPTLPNNDNHAFYVGKFRPQSLGDKTLEALDLKRTPGRLYSREFLLGMLKDLFARLPEASKARVVIARSLSEIFNGPEDMNGTSTFEEQKSLIETLAKTHFNREPEALDIVDMETEPLNVRLFKKLRHSGSVFEGSLPELSPSSDALDLAHHLHDAIQKDETLRDAFLNTLPGDLEENPEAEHLMQYSVMEVAIRLAALLHGRFIQGGAERQEVYDRLIQRLMKGKFSEPLEDLQNLFKEKRFETLHLNTEKNIYQKKKKQNIARTRLALVGALALGLVQGGRMLEQHAAAEGRARVRYYLADALKDRHFYGPIGREEIQNTESKVNAFLELNQIAMELLTERYPHISSSLYPDLAVLLNVFMMSTEGLTTAQSNYTYNGDISKLIQMVDQFVAENQLFLLEKGVHATQSPYENLLPYASQFKEFLSSAEDITLPASAEMSLKKIADMTHSGGSSFKYSLYFYPHAASGKPVFVARMNQESLREDWNNFSSQRARILIENLMWSVRRASATSLHQWENSSLDHPLSALYEPNSFNHYTENFTLEPRDYLRIFDFKDPFGAYHFEIAEDYKMIGKNFQRIALARLPNEPLFTTQRAQEAAAIYKTLFDTFPSSSDLYK